MLSFERLRASAAVSDGLKGLVDAVGDWIDGGGGLPSAAVEGDEQVPRDCEPNSTRLNS